MDRKWGPSLESCEWEFLGSLVGSAQAAEVNGSQSPLSILCLQWGCWIIQGGRVVLGRAARHHVYHCTVTVWQKYFESLQHILINNSLSWRNVYSQRLYLTENPRSLGTFKILKNTKKFSNSLAEVKRTRLFLTAGFMNMHVQLRNCCVYPCAPQLSTHTAILSTWLDIVMTHYYNDIVMIQIFSWH